MTTELTAKEQDDLICKRPLRDMNLFRFGLFLIGRSAAHEIFSRVVGRAYEKSIINSKQLHELHGIWNRMSGKEKP